MRLARVKGSCVLHLAALTIGLLWAAGACDTQGVPTGATGGGLPPAGGGGAGSGGATASGGGGVPVPSPASAPDYGQSLAALTAVHDCGELVEELRAAALDEMEETLDANLATALEWVSWGGSCGYWWDVDCDAMAGGGPPPPNEEGASSYSETNNQVAGVDEADFVKNDGSYVYILADGRFQIIDAWPPEEAHIASSRGIEGTPKRMFVAADRAVIYSALQPLPRPEDDSPWGPYRYGGWGGVSASGYGDGECTYGYNCDFTGDGHAAKLTVFDITDRTDPVLIREIELSGSYLNSRRIGAAVHTVAFFPGAIFPGVAHWPTELLERCWEDYDLELTEEMVRAAFEELREANRAAIEEASIVDFLPGVRDTRYVEGRPITEEGLFADCDSFFVDEESFGAGFLGLLSFDIEGYGAIHPTTVVGDPGAVYASHDALYVATRQHRRADVDWYWGDDEDAPQEASTLHKFHLLNDPPRSFYAGSGVVKGRVLNQFAMDEHEGYLRIATTTGRVPHSDVHSTLSTLVEFGGTLVLTGQVDDIAPTEDIRSVRFAGPRGYVVTFKKTDPLFVIDLADPARPEILGELKIPGFSTYMHPLDADHVLSIGYDADDQGSFAWFTGIMLQIFDVSDPRDPRLTHKEVIGSRGSTSEAATNHLAFNYFAPRDLLAIPMTVCEGGHGGSYGDRMTFSGLMVYRTTSSTGFDYLGGVSHAMPETDDEYWGACNNWWTNSNSIVQRSIFLDDYVFSITPEEIRVDMIYDLGTDLAVIDLVRATD